MRAIFFENIDFIDKDLHPILEVIDKKQVHHLSKVVRIKLEESVLILNGRGLKLKAVVKSISNKIITLEIIEIKNISFSGPNISIALALTKKDALIDSIRVCTELGIKNIYLMNTKRSNKDYKFDEKLKNKLNRIQESSIIQSNNYFMPKIFCPVKFNEIVKSQKGQSILFHSDKVSKNFSKEFTNRCIDKEITAFIGPEGGFDNEEIQYFISNSDGFITHLNTPIQRTPTAIASCVGYLHGNIIDT